MQVTETTEGDTLEEGELSSVRNYVSQSFCFSSFPWHFNGRRELSSAQWVSNHVPGSPSAPAEKAHRGSGGADSASLLATLLPSLQKELHFCLLCTLGFWVEFCSRAKKEFWKPHLILSTHWITIYEPEETWEVKNQVLPVVFLLLSNPLSWHSRSSLMTTTWFPNPTPTRWPGFPAFVKDFFCQFS